MSTRDASTSRADDVGAVIVNWNSSADLLDCVRVIGASFPDVTVVVIDNRSEPEQYDQLADLPGGVELVSLDANNGYAAGVNAGIAALDRLGKTWAWLINPDARPDPMSLDRLLFASSGAVALSPRQYSSARPGSGSTYASAATTRRGRVTAVLCDGCSNGVHEVDVVTGTGLLVQVQRSLEVGLLDESFFHYKEEFEFVERLSSLGAVRLVCHAGVWHRRGGSLAHESPQATYYRVRNELLYLRKRSRIWFATPRVARTILRSLVSSIRNVPSRQHSKAIRAAVLAGVTGTSGQRSVS